MSERIRSIVGKLSQEAIMILAIGLTALVSLFAAWSSLAGQIEELRTAMYEGDSRLLAAMHTGDDRLRRERREDVAALRGEIRAMGQRIDRMGQRIDRLTETVMLVVTDVRRGPQAPGTGPGASDKRKSEENNP